MSLNRQNFLDPSLLARMQSLPLAARYVAEGAIGGFHKSPYLGHNAEFSHHREYMPGDELRHIDWKRYAKSEKFYVRQYEESSSLNALVILDDSASMRSQSDFLQKHIYARLLVSSLAWLLLHQRDGFGFLSFADQVIDFLPISTKRSRFNDLIGVLEKNSQKTKTSLLPALQTIIPRIRKKCIVILISDFLQSEEEIAQSVRLLCHHRHEVIAFHLMSREDLSFPWKEYANFVDVETGQMMGIEGRSASGIYQENLRNFLARIRLSLTQVGVDYQLMDTSVPVEKSLIHYLYKRSRFV